MLGVGIGTVTTPEFSGFGEVEDLATRGSMLDEGLEVIEALWSGEEMHHRGPHYRVEGVRFRPAPLQHPLPVWVAAVWPNRKPLRRAARFQGVVPLVLPGPEALAEVFSIVGEGKDVAVPAGGHSIRSWEDAGATWILHEVGHDGTVTQVEELIDEGPPGGG